MFPRVFIFSFFVVQFLGIGSVKSQSEIGVSVSAIYNVEQQAMGVGFRLAIPTEDKFYAVPYLSYYFTNNKVEVEFSLILFLVI